MEGRIRAFIAVEIPPEAVARLDPLLADLASLGRDLKVVKRENLHFTLKFLGNIGSDMIGSVGDCMSSASGLLGFEIAIGGFGAFPNSHRPRVLWIGVKDGQDRMIQLAEDLDAALSELGFERERNHVPHLTLARNRSRRRSPGISSFIESMEDIEIGTMTVDAIKLKKSVLTPRGPTYSDVLETRYESEAG